jgi:zinc D-Ala-D-Ala dipeptidase
MMIYRRTMTIGLAAVALTGCNKPLQTVKAKQRRTPVEADQPGDLIDLTVLDPSIRLDIRYATANNFTGQILYDQPRAFLVRVAAEALVRAHQKALADGFGLTIFDGYRPLSVTQKLWDATPPGPKRNYVANPAKGSRHNRGCAVDLSLHDRADGKLVAMPSGYDEFTRRAHRDFMDAAPAAIANRQRLAHYLEAEGFRGMSNEWWHFDFNGWEQFPILNVPFTEIG